MSKTAAVKNHPGVYSYQTRSGKRYAVVVTVKGKQRWQQGFRTLEEADAARDRLRTSGTAPAKMTLAQYLTEKWLPTVEGKPRTIENYKADVQRIIKTIGDVHLLKLEPLDVERMKTALRKAGLAPATQHHTYQRLSQALKQARRWRLIQYNPCEDADAPDKGSYLPPVVDMSLPDILDQVKRLLEVSDAHGYGLMVYFSIMTGMREREVFGLEWSHIDFAEATLRIPRANTKTDKGQRPVLLDPDMLERLRQHRLEQMQKLQAAPRMVFTDRKGLPWYQPKWQHYWERIRLEAGVPTMHYHDLRHINATLLSRAKVDPKVAQQRLGHADISTTLGIYTHTHVDEQRGAVEALRGLLA